MQCIKCGREIPDGELFCSACAAGPSAPKRTPSPKRVSHAAEPPRKNAPALRGRGKLIAAVVVLSLLLAMVLAYVGYDLLVFNQKKTNLVVREADLTLRESEQEEREQELAEAQKAVEDANAQIADLQTQIEELNTKMAGSESDFYQSQYDQKLEMTQLAGENETLYSMVEELENKNDSLQAQLTVANNRAAAREEKANFLDTYAVFVENDGTSYYHNYSCASFKKKSFWVYSRKLAESYGYTACPSCGG